MKHIFTLAFLACMLGSYAQVGIVTWEVNMANEEVSPDGVYLAGGDYFGIPGDNPMADDDGDGIWTITLAMPLGYTGAYTFTNGACTDWSCKENIVGQECAYGQWSDRLLPEVTSAGATISTCFSQCSTDGSCATLTSSDVTFRVDMSEQVATDGVFLHAAFDGWGAIPMNDDNGDDVYEYTVNLEEGVYQYLFQNGEGGNEQFDSTYVECTLTSGAYTNRLLEVSGGGDIVMDAYCFNSCSACEGGGGNDSILTVTFNVNMANEEVDPTGVFLAGGASFGAPGDNPMSDDDGDGIYSITMEVDSGFSSHYTFTNGACGDWSCKENLAGLPCGDPNNYNDRFLEPVTQDVVLSTCFGQCSTDGSCEANAPIPVTFRVDMSEQLVISGVTIFGGSINGWNNTATPMSDDDGDGVYEATVELTAGGHEYKFVNSGVEEVFDPIVHGECTVTTPDSVYTNRYLFIEAEESITTDAYCFNACVECESSTDVDEAMGLEFQLVPNVTSDLVELRLNQPNAFPMNVTVVSYTGSAVMMEQIPAGVTSWTLDMTSEANGLYFVQLESQGMGLTQRLVKVQ